MLDVQILSRYSCRWEISPGAICADACLTQQTLWKIRKKLWTETSSHAPARFGLRETLAFRYFHRTGISLPAYRAASGIDPMGGSLFHGYGECWCLTVA
jgi:hypothetical protein